MTWDETKPPSGGDLISAEIRGNNVALQRAIGGQNLVRDSEQLIWADGDNVAPTHYRTSGNGHSIERAGIGRPDPAHYWSDSCSKLTSGAGAPALEDHTLLGSSGFKLRMRGDHVSVGCALQCAIPNSLRIGIFDGIDTTFSEPVPASGTEFVWMKATRRLHPEADRIVLRTELAAGAIVGYIADAAALWGEIPPSGPIASRVGWAWVGPGTQVGDLAAGNFINGWSLSLMAPAFARWTSLRALQAPLGQDAIVDVRKNGVSLYTPAGRPRILPGANPPEGGAAPDGPYATRCFRRGDVLSCDQVQAGVGTRGANQTIQVALLCFISPLDVHLGVQEAA